MKIANRIYRIVIRNYSPIQNTLEPIKVELNALWIPAIVRYYTPPLVPTDMIISTVYHPLFGTIRKHVKENPHLIAWKTTKGDGAKLVLFKLPQRKTTQLNTGSNTMTTQKSQTEQEVAAMAGQALADALTAKAKASAGSALQPNTVTTVAVQPAVSKDLHPAVAAHQNSSPEHLPAATIAARIFHELSALEKAAAQVQAYDLTVLGVRTSPQLGSSTINVLNDCKVQLDGLDDLVLNAILVRSKELEVALGSMGIDVDVQALLKLPSYTA